MEMGLPGVGGLLGMMGVLAGAAAVFLSGPPTLVRVARALGVAALVVSVAGVVQGAFREGFQLDPTQGAGQASLLATGGMLLLTFGAARVADQRRLRLEQERRAAARERARAARPAAGPEAPEERRIDA